MEKSTCGHKTSKSHYLFSHILENIRNASFYWKFNPIMCFSLYREPVNIFSLHACRNCLQPLLHTHIKSFELVCRINIQYIQVQRTVFVKPSGTRGFVACTRECHLISFMYFQTSAWSFSFMRKWLQFHDSKLNA